MLSPSMKSSLTEFLNSDISPGDATSSLLTKQKCRAEIVLKEKAVLAGIGEAEFVFRELGAEARLKEKEGEWIEKGSKVMEVHGNNSSILSAERTALNILARMSGVATAGKRALGALPKGSKVKLAVTRKTLPGLNEFDKKAASLAGVDTHRLNLSEMVLLKDNHLHFFASAEEAVKKAKEKTSFTKKVGVEVKNAEEALSAAKAEPDLIMLDNFSVQEAKKTIPKLRKNRSMLVELSGGINLQSLLAYAKLSPDIISLGFLTQSARSIDFSLKVK